MSNNYIRSLHLPGTLLFYCGKCSTSGISIGQINYLEKIACTQMKKSRRSQGKTIKFWQSLKSENLFGCNTFLINTTVLIKL